MSTRRAVPAGNTLWVKLAASKNVKGNGNGKVKGNRNGKENRNGKGIGKREG